MDVLIDFLENIASILTTVAGIGFTIAFIIYGFKLATSAGNPQTRSNSIAGLWWTALGAIVSFGAYFIIEILKDIAP